MREDGEEEGMVILSWREGGDSKESRTLSFRGINKYTQMVIIRKFTKGLYNKKNITRFLFLSFALPFASPVASPVASPCLYRYYDHHCRVTHGNDWVLICSK